jgi:hypothetical protein
MEPTYRYARCKKTRTWYHAGLGACHGICGRVYRRIEGQAAPGIPWCDQCLDEAEAALAAGQSQLAAEYARQEGT